jgi:hypothetical protein
MLNRLRNSILYLGVSAFVLLICERMLVERLVHTSQKGNFLGCLVLAGPLFWGIFQRRTMRRWVRSENISEAAAFQENRNDAAMVLMSYGIVFMILAITAAQ